MLLELFFKKRLVVCILFPRIVIVGCGNPLYADDGFGPAVIEELYQHALPPGVKAIDAGTGGNEYVFSLLDPLITRYLIVIDAADFRAPPGTLKVLELSQCPAHRILNANPGGIAQALMSLQEKIHITVLVCQPGRITYPEMSLGLSPEVRSAIPSAIAIIIWLIRKIIRISPGQVQDQYRIKYPYHTMDHHAREKWSYYPLFAYTAGSLMQD
jgi:coenzyme F420 hydrogenase subunit delta